MELARETDSHVEGEFLVGVSTDALVADQAPILEGGHGEIRVGAAGREGWCQPRNKRTDEGISLVVQWLRLHAPNVGGPDLIPAQGTRSHMPKVQIHMPQLKIPQAVTKIEDLACCSYGQCSQINTFFKHFKKKN